MDLHVQRRLAAAVLKCSPSRVYFDPERLDEIKEVITKQDLRSLVGDGAIVKLHAQGVSRVRANMRKEQRKKGRQQGKGSRKGGAETHKEGKHDWMDRVRVQRAFIKQLTNNDTITKETANDVFRKSKGGFFRSKRHVKLYLEEHSLFLKGQPESVRVIPDAVTANKAAATKGQPQDDAGENQNRQKRLHAKKPGA